MIDETFEKILDHFYWNVLHNDLDLVIVIIGRERSGKSTLSGETALYINKMRKRYWNLPPIYDAKKDKTFRASQFGQAVADSKEKGRVIVYDEGVTGMNARTAMSVTNVALNDILYQCGMKNLVLVVNIPAFFGLDKNVRTRRVAIVLNVLMKSRKIRDEKGNVFNQIVRGYFDAYIGKDISKIQEGDNGVEVFGSPTFRNLRFTRSEENQTTDMERSEKQKNIEYAAKRIREAEEKKNKTAEDGKTKRKD